MELQFASSVVARDSTRWGRENHRGLDWPQQSGDRVGIAQRHSRIFEGQGVHILWNQDNIGLASPSKSRASAGHSMYTFRWIGYGVLTTN